MPEYRRFKLPHSTYFFTVVTYQRQPILVTEESLACLHTAFKSIQEKYPFTIEGIVVLPDHIHTLWSLPENDDQFSLRWNLIKNRFTRRADHLSREPFMSTASRHAKREKTIWQRRFWEHRIRDEHDFIHHLEYIHYNPVKHGYTNSPGDWKWSSFSRYVNLGWYPPDWGSQPPHDILTHCVGE